MTDHTYPEALQEIIETFRDASQEERLDMLLEYAMNLPDLPEELHNARDTMEQVHECQSPVFLSAKLLDDKVPGREVRNHLFSRRSLERAAIAGESPVSEK
jgi:cysteine desulfuration protein SufE